MLKKHRLHVIHLTQYILEQYWQRNLEPLVSHLHKDIMWVGSMDEEYFHGKEAMLERLKENNSEMPPVYMDNQEYEVVHSDGNTCIVVGRYRGYTKPESGILLCDKQRVTFVWEKIKAGDTEEFLIRHIHLSNILHFQAADERFPTRAGKENYEYMQRILAERSRNEVVTIKDENLVNRVVNYTDIMYIVADHNYIILHLADEQEDVRMRGNLSAFVKGLPPAFVQASRSFCINKSYVRSLQGQNLIMIDGKEFKVPAAAKKQMREAVSGKGNPSAASVRSSQPARK